MAKILNTNNILFKILINNYIKSQKTILSFSTLNVTKNESNEEIIKIPKRVDRGPTDILRALAQTTQRDLNGPDYRYMDDPYLTPHSNHEKRVFSLSRESGRRAAKYLFEEFPELFFRDNSEPKIEAFTYKEIYNENTKVDEIDLIKSISRKEVNNSIICYKNLVRDSKPICSQSLQQLLELVCFYNCEEPSDLEFTTEKIFMKQTDSPRLLWKDNGFAEQLFDAIEEKTSETYCALIQGMAKYSQSQKAYQYYQEMIEKGFKLDVETYNSLVKIVPTLRESTDTRWLYIEDILNSMKNNGIKPNLHSMNNILEVIVRFGTLRIAQNSAKKTLVEMTKKLGITPSLATYYHLLNIFYKERGPTTSALHEIIDEIENKEFEIQDPNDVYFFVKSMTICNFKLNDKTLAYRIHRMLDKTKNYKLLGSVLIESNYYQHFFRLLLKTEDFKIFMDFYRKYVPHVYIPEPVVITEMLKSIDLYDAYNYLPTIWTDFKNFEYVTNIKLSEQFFSLLPKVKEDKDLSKTFSKIVTEGLKIIDNRIENQLKEGHIHINLFTGELLGYAIDVYLNDNDIENAIEIVNKLTDQKKKVIGSPSPQTLIRLCLKAIDNKMYTYVKHLVQLSLEMSMTEVGLQVLQHIRPLDLDPNIKNIFEEMSSEIEMLSNQTINETNDINFDKKFD